MISYAVFCLKKNIKSYLKHELDRIWITSDEKKFLRIDDALKHEETLEKKRAIIQKEEDKVTEIHKLFLKVLNRNNWGLYFKGEPISRIPTNDDSMVSVSYTHLTLPTILRV